MKSGKHILSIYDWGRCHVEIKPFTVCLLLLLPSFPVYGQERDLDRILKRQDQLRSVIDQVSPAFVFIANGSGVCISEDGWILTNHHVAGNNRTHQVHFSGGRSYPAKVIGFDPYGDISVLKIENEKGLPFCDLGDSDQIKIGQPVIAVGNPFLLGRQNWQPSITYGIVSALHRYMDNPGYFDAIQTDAQINPGNSGGPLITLEGKVIGINGRIDIKRFRNRVNTGIGYAIPSNQIRRYLTKFKAGGRVREGYLSGVTVGECGDPRYENTLEYGDGVFIAGLEEESPAAKSGLQLGDIIVGGEKYPIHNLNRFHGVMANWPQGEKILIHVKRKQGDRWESHSYETLLGTSE